MLAKEYVKGAHLLCYRANFLMSVSLYCLRLVLYPDILTTRNV